MKLLLLPILFLAFYALLGCAGNFGSRKTKSRESLNINIKICNNPDSLLAAAETEFQAFDTIALSPEKNADCNNRCLYHEKLMNEFIKKAQKGGTRIHQIRSNHLLANIQTSYYRRIYAFTRNAPLEQRMGFRKKILTECDSYLKKAADYLKTNFEKYRDSISIGQFCDIAIKESDIIINAGCILASPATKSDSIGPDYPNIDDGSVDMPETFRKMINFLSHAQDDYKSYKELNSDGFNRIDQKIRELNSLLNDPEKQEEICQKALNPD